MIEPVTLLATFITLWAQLHNYGIDVDANEHLRNIRVRRDIYSLRSKEQTGRNDWKNSLILNSFNNRRRVENQPFHLQRKENKDGDKLMSILRGKRSYKTNYNGNNNRQISYIDGKVPLANYPPESPYYSQNTDGVPYIYTSYNYNIGNGNNNVGNGNNNVGNGNKQSNQYKTAVNIHGQSSVITQHSNLNIYNDLATTGRSNGNIIKRMSQYVMPSNSSNTNNGYQNNHATTVSSNGYQNSYNQGIYYNSYPNRNTTQGTNSGSRQFYNPFGSQANSYNRTNGFTTQGVNNNGYGISSTGNGNNNFGNGSNNSGIWNYNTEFVYNNTRYRNYNTGYLNNNTGISNNHLGSGNNTAIWNVNGNGQNYVGNGTNNAGNGKNNTERVQQSYFMGGVGCPQFFKSVTLFGTKMCLEDIDY